MPAPRRSFVRKADFLDPAVADPTPSESADGLDLNRKLFLLLGPRVRSASRPRLGASGRIIAQIGKLGSGSGAPIRPLEVPDEQILAIFQPRDLRAKQTQRKLSSGNTMPLARPVTAPSMPARADGQA